MPTSLGFWEWEYAKRADAHITVTANRCVCQYQPATDVHQHLNTLSPESDQHQFSANSIHTL